MGTATRAAIIRQIRFGYTCQAIAAQTGEELAVIEELAREVRSRERVLLNQRRTSGYNNRPAGATREQEFAREALLRAGYSEAVVRANFW